MTNGSTRTRPAPRVVATDVGFSEGPLYTPSGDTYFTSITHGRLYRLTDGGGRQPAETAGRGGHGAEVAAELGGGANGATLAADGSIYVAQNGARWSTTGPRWGKDSLGGVQVVRPDGSHHWVHRDPIAPNDLCFGPDGMLYVTDPTRTPFGADGRLWRIDTATEEAELLTSTSYFPNGIGFGSTTGSTSPRPTTHGSSPTGSSTGASSTSRPSCRWTSGTRTASRSTPTAT